MNLPNSITASRIATIPILIWMLSPWFPANSAHAGLGGGRQELLASGLFILAMITDGLDGYLARRRKQITTLGMLLDPLADKLMIAAALISLVSLDRLAAWVAMVIIAREFAVSGLRIAAGQQGVVIPASGLGKVKTIVQVAAVLALIAANDPDAVWVQALVYTMVAVTLASGADYFLNFRRRIDEAGRDRATAARQQP
jgi:CDP-diacylglycerol--glycerol-3-phosphate 3-phosphatidyltransferase